VELWLTTSFEGGRHERRVRQIEEIEREEATR
jgi:ribose 5-phosphate isomerase RpiB